MKNIPGTISRLILDKLKRGFENNRIIIITGSRQAGKTTVMRIYQNLIPKNFKCFYFDLEDIVSLNACQSVENLKYYLKDNGADIEKDKVFLIIDEFQYIKNATKLFKIIYDLFPFVNILASGSSSIEIQKHLKESLAGRNLDVRNVSRLSADIYNKNYLSEYLLYGGYPKVALLKCVWMGKQYISFPPFF